MGTIFTIVHTLYKPEIDSMAQKIIYFSDMKYSETIAYYVLSWIQAFWSLQFHAIHGCIEQWKPAWKWRSVYHFEQGWMCWLGIEINGLWIWDLNKWVQATKANHKWNPCDLVTYLVWLTRKDGVLESLCMGMGLGYLMMWRQHADTITEFNEVWSRRIGTG